jgi:nitroreductase
MMFNDLSSTLSLLHTRRSIKARDLAAPAPSADELDHILRAAIRVPDHGKLNPWRFVIIAGERRQHFADIIESAFRAEKPQASDGEVAGARSYALDGASLVAVLSTPVACPIPVWEQHLSAGAAIQNALIAAHALGYVGNWLTGWPAYSAAVIEALGGSPDDRIAGFLYFGTPSKALEERPRPNAGDVIRHF